MGSDTAAASPQVAIDRRGPMSTVRLVRVISRLNMGGPAIQAISLSSRLEPLGYRTTLVRGVEGPREGSMDALATELGIRPTRVRSLQRELGTHDVRALAEVTRLLRRVRPDVLHTHAAKAGAIGRLAALLAGRQAPPVRVHTFHGHVLEGYFSPARAAAFRAIERSLARSTTRLVAVSEEVREDLVRLGIAGRGRIEVVPLGFDLSQFALSGHDRDRGRAAMRTALGIPQEARVVTLIARLVPIKRVDRFLSIAAQLWAREDVRFLVVGDGELRESLLQSRAASELGGRLVWAGFQRDIPRVLAATDVAVQTSDNEGTPVSLIEAQASGLPVVTTDVGGVPSAVLNGRTGWLVRPGEDSLFAARVGELLDDTRVAASFGARGREHVRERFSLDRLTADLDDLYRRLLAERA